MHKKLIDKNDIYSIIEECYSSDDNFIKNFHELNNASTSDCISRTANDLVKYDVKIFGLYNNDELVGYFGDELFENTNWLSGFFIIPKYRKEFKTKIWEAIVNHFNSNFNVAMMVKNIPAKRYLLNNGCKFKKLIVTSDGIAEVFEYMENK